MNQQRKEEIFNLAVFLMNYVPEQALYERGVSKTLVVLLDQSIRFFDPSGKQIALVTEAHGLGQGDPDLVFEILRDIKAEYLRTKP